MGDFSINRPHKAHKGCYSQKEKTFSKIKLFFVRERPLSSRPSLSKRRKTFKDPKRRKYALNHED